LEHRVKKLNRRWAALFTLSAGLLFSDSCDVSGAIWETINLALGIVDVWV
jgi:hypothetical protein